MSHMPLGAHGVAISTIFNVEIFKQIQQILEKFQYSDTDTSKLESIQIQIQTDTDQSIYIQIQILEKGLYLYLYPSEYLYLLNPIVQGIAITVQTIYNDMELGAHAQGFAEKQR